MALANKGLLMGAEDLSDHDKLDMVEEWAANVPTFDTTFIDSLRERMSRIGYLSSAQEEALDNIIDKWKIYEWSLRNGR